MASSFYWEIFCASSIWYSKYRWMLKTMLDISTVVPISNDKTIAPIVIQLV
jgi:hypothetical protein